jgi:diadenosine tetraphosphate (Ap4A) HIT family hydrolase
VPGGVLLHDTHLHATLWTPPDGPDYLGRIVLHSRRHLPSLGDLTPAEGVALGAATQRLGVALRETLPPELVYLESYMEAVRHLHAFFMPRYPGTPREFVRQRLTAWPQAPRADKGASEQLAERLRAVLARIRSA